MTTFRTGIALAANAALLAAAVASMPTLAIAKDKAPATVHCYGVNTCKGSSDCATAHNSCKGQNTCKGQGFKELTKDQCSAAGGSLTEAK